MPIVYFHTSRAFWKNIHREKNKEKKKRGREVKRRYKSSFYENPGEVQQIDRSIFQTARFSKLSLSRRIKTFSLTYINPIVGGRACCIEERSIAGVFTLIQNA